MWTHFRKSRRTDIVEGFYNSVLKTKGFLIEIKEENDIGNHTICVHGSLWSPNITWMGQQIDFDFTKHKTIKFLRMSIMNVLGTYHAEDGAN